jgi:hypothetical protein
MRAPAMNSTVAALHVFFTHMLDRADFTRKLIRIPYFRKLPKVLALEEMGSGLSQAAELVGE